MGLFLQGNIPSHDPYIIECYRIVRCPEDDSSSCASRYKPIEDKEIPGSPDRDQYDRRVVTKLERPRRIPLTPTSLSTSINMAPL